MANSKNKFDIVAHKKLYLIIPAAILAATILVILLFGAKVSIEFTGGTILQYSYTGEEINVNEVSASVSDLGFNSAVITTGSAFGSDLQLLNFSFSASDGMGNDEQAQVTAMLQQKYPDKAITLENNQNVSATTGMSFFLKCLVAFVFAFLVFIIYIAYRFKKIGGWSTGIFALIALLIDIIVVVAVFVFFRLPIDSIFMAVILTIMGYSINNTIIVFDRVRENKSLQNRQLSARELINKSVRQSLTRSINTTVTTAAALLALSIVAVIFGVATILNFAFPLTIGLVSGIFTSLCVSGTFWATWQERKIRKG
ncbi:MAG: protein translocase subunit SecF [Oscillospiraceae bacterium]|nr:protein translocase subunit SecF [Oscillospiraceae bacterium]